MNVLKSIVVWMCFVPAAILNGGLREYVLVQAVGESRALPLSGIILSILIFLVTWLLFPRIVKNCTSGESWLIGAAWVCLTVIFEFAGGLASGETLGNLVQAYNPLSGNLWLLVLAVTAFSPVIVRKRKNRPDA